MFISRESSQEEVRTISWILTSWNGTNLLALVCMVKLPSILSDLHASDGHSVSGRNVRLRISWKASSPHDSHEYALTRT